MTLKDLAEGSFRDKELRTVVQGIASRVKRLETVSERLEVRRQALLETYHNQGLSQSRISFYFSLTLGVLGFAVIVFAVITRSQEIGVYVSGVITEAVAALFFTQSNRARRLMADFFDKLRDDRKLEEGLRLALKIENPDLRASVQALLAMHLMGSEVSPTILPGFSVRMPESENGNHHDTVDSVTAAAVHAATKRAERTENYDQ
jgi:hypothetical protein